MAQGDLTATSYLVLGMLVDRDLSAYEIAAQVGKGLAEVWPRAERQRYNTPKRLVEQGMATARIEATGRRERTVYSITDVGREALRAWLATEPAPASLEFEGLIRLLVVEQGTVEDLRATLRTVIEQARTKRQIFVMHAQTMLDPERATFPEREHGMALANRFMIGHYTHIIEWAEWALVETETWSDAVTPRQTHHERTQEILRAVTEGKPGW
jgi:PadR family transcriptional regulator, regulatory protein AphA